MKDVMLSRLSALSILPPRNAAANGKSRQCRVGLSFPGGHREGQEIWYRLAPQRIEHGAARGEAMRDPVGPAVAFQRRAPFAASHKDLQAGVGHALELPNELTCTVLEARVFKHTEDAVVEGHYLGTAGGGVRRNELTDLAAEQFARFWSHVKLLPAWSDGI